jgi:hypothetical protein
MAAPEARSTISGEEIYRVALGQGIYTAELPSNIPDGFSQLAYNLVATGDSLENRIGLRPSSVDFHLLMPGFPTGFGHYFNQLTTDDAGLPVLAWGNSTGVGNSFSFIRGAGAGAGDGYMEVIMPAPVQGVAQYAGWIYFAMGPASTGIYKCTSFDWVADAMTYTSIPSSAPLSPLTGLFTFKERIWGWHGDELYFTEIAATGGLPESWSTTNFIPFRGTLGSSLIVNVIPMQNKLLVFTTAGLYTLLVQGEPASWILRVLDNGSFSTHPRSAFESKGIVYYVNTTGVWATNGISVTKLSGVIEDKFFLSKGRRIHFLHEYEDGMILSIAKLADTGYLESDACVNFYTKLEPIAWTEWGIHAPEGETNGFADSRLCAFLSVSKKVSTFLSSDPTVYVLAAVTNSTAAVNLQTRMNLIIFDGGEDKMRDGPGTLITTPVRVALKTKYMDGGNPFALKYAKEAMLELFTSDTRHMFNCSWDIDATISATSRISGRQDFIDFASGRSSNLIRLPAEFHWRRCAFSFSSSLQTNTSQIKIKDLALRMDTGRPEFEQTR